MTEKPATVSQMPTKGQLRHAYADPQVNIRRYIDIYVETGNHELAICVTKYGLHRKTVERAERLGVPVIQLSEQAARYDLSVTQCLDLVSYGDDWQEAILRLCSARKHDDEWRFHQNKYVQLRSVYSHTDAWFVLTQLKNYWARFTVISGTDTARHVRKITSFGKLGLKPEDLAELLTDGRLTPYWEHLGAPIAQQKVTVDELRVIASEEGNVIKYVILKDALGDHVHSHLVNELARASHQSVTEIKQYAGWRKRGKDHEDAWARAFHTCYAPPVD